MKVALFAFNGESMCFTHVLLNALEMHGRGWEVKVVLEGSACALPEEYAADPEHPFAKMYYKVKELGLIDCACRACANKMGGLGAIEAEGIELCDDMQGHPSMARYLEQGYQVINF